MFETLARTFGRNARIRGAARLLRWVYPVGPTSTRFVHGVRVCGDGARIEVDTRQEIDWEMYFHGAYEPHLASLFELVLSEGMVAVDVGANVGAHSLTLARLVGRTGHVLAFEPNPVIRKKLTINLGLNAMSQVQVFGDALGDKADRMQLRVPKSDSPEASNPGLASIFALDTPHDLVDIDVRVFDQLTRVEDLDRCDLIKIDVQGFEESVLDGMRATLNRFHPVVVFEYEDWAWRQSGSEWAGVCDLFGKLGYELWHLASVGSRMPPTPLAAMAGNALSHFEVLAAPPGHHVVSRMRR